MLVSVVATRFVAIAALFWGLWLALAGSLHPQELVAGGFVALGFAAAATLGTRGAEVCLLHPRRLYHLGLLLPYLLVAIIQSNLDVAWRVLQPRVRIRPGIVRVKTRLKSPLGRLALTSCITLTPGTLSVEADGEDLFIHWIDVQSGDVAEATRTIVAGFERHLEVIFG